MYKLIIILYLVCFGLYILFSRQPDYFDGVTTKGIIHFAKDSVTGNPYPAAVYWMNKISYSVNAAYLFKTYKEGEQVNIIYEASQPEKATVYSVWGYWFKWNEILFSLVLLIGMFQVAVAITKNPVPESLIEQLESKSRVKRKYKR
ncbi:MAG TPA: hypothetical protein VH396_02440 [Chitinophagaceae bacterium]